MQTKVLFTGLTFEQTYAYFIDIVPKTPKNKFGWNDCPAYDYAAPLFMLAP